MRCILSQIQVVKVSGYHDGVQFLDKSRGKYISEY